MNKFLSPWIQTTNRCNLQCGYCYLCQDKKDMDDNVYAATCEFLSRKIDEGFEVKLRIAGGEPTLTFKKWSKFFAPLVEKNGCSAEILTNLAIIPNGFVSFLESNLKFGVNVSLDSLSYSKPFKNGKSSSDTVIKNIDTIKKHRDIFVMTVLTDNGKHLPELAKYVIANGFRWEVQFNKLAENIDKEKVIRNLKLVVDEFKRKSLRVSEHLLFNFCDFTKNRECSAGKEMFYIATEGDIYNCQMQTETTPLGTIFDKNLMGKLRKNNPARPFLNLCGDCKIFNYCHGDCPTHNNPERRKYLCDIMKEYFIYAA